MQDAGKEEVAYCIRPSGLRHRYGSINAKLKHALSVRRASTSLGGAERLVVDAALGLQKLGHSVDIYTSHHDSSHCFEETRDGTLALSSFCVQHAHDQCTGTLKVHAPKSPFPRSFRGKLHIVFANARQLHLTAHLLRPGAPKYDVYFVDQLSTCIPLLRVFGHTRVLFYCHFPDKLLADGAYEEGRPARKDVGLLKRLYRAPMDWIEEVTTRTFTYPPFAWLHVDSCHAHQGKPTSSLPTPNSLFESSKPTSNPFGPFHVWSTRVLTLQRTKLERCQIHPTLTCWQSLRANTFYFQNERK